MIARHRALGSRCESTDSDAIAAHRIGMEAEYLAELRADQAKSEQTKNDAQTTSVVERMDAKPLSGAATARAEMLAHNQSLSVRK